MKLKHLIFTVFICFFSCDKSLDHEEQLWSFDSEISYPEEKITHVNDMVEIQFKTSNYNYRKGAKQMYIKGNSEKRGAFYLQNVRLEMNKLYAVPDNGSIFYKGEEKGLHKPEVTLSNKHENYIHNQIEKEFVFIDFDHEIFGDEDSVLQGEETEIRIIINEGGSIADQYEIQFLSFDDKDLDLKESYIKLDRVERILRKWYSVSDKEDIKIVLYTPNKGSHSLRYKLRNKTNTIEGDIKINVEPRKFEVEIIDRNGDIYPNQEVDYYFNIDNEAYDGEEYEVKFISYEGGERVYLENSRANFGKWIKINETVSKLTLTSDSKGTKKLVFRVRDGFGNEVETEINQDIKSEDIKIIGIQAPSIMRYDMHDFILSLDVKPMKDIQKEDIEINIWSDIQGFRIHNVTVGSFNHEIPHYPNNTWIDLFLVNNNALNIDNFNANGNGVGKVHVKLRDKVTGLVSNEISTSDITIVPRTIATKNDFYLSIQSQGNNFMHSFLWFDFESKEGYTLKEVKVNVYHKYHGKIDSWNRVINKKHFKYNKEFKHRGLTPYKFETVFISSKDDDGTIYEDVKRRIII